MPGRECIWLGGPGVTPFEQGAGDGVQQRMEEQGPRGSELRGRGLKLKRLLKGGRIGKGSGEVSADTEGNVLRRLFTSRMFIRRCKRRSAYYKRKL